MSILRSGFKAQDLLRVGPVPPLDTCWTYLLSHIVRCGGDKQKLALIRQGLYEIDNFIVECLSENFERVN